MTALDPVAPLRRLGGRGSMVALLLMSAVGLAACESTQDRSDRIGREGGSTKIDTKGLEVARQNPKVTVVSTKVLQDANGAAVVVAMRNATRRPLAGVPISIAVRGRRGKTLFRNDAPGIEPSLAATPLLPAHGTFLWVNDQVSVTEPARSVRARTGGGKQVGGRRLPRIVLGKARLTSDPVSGVAASGFVTNRSQVEQRKLVVYAVARRGGRVVAAGRAQVNRLKPGKRARFQVFFIGNPRGAVLQLSVPPTRLS